MNGRARYHVPRNQCFAGSRGGTRANVHLYPTEPLRSGRLIREPDQSLCGAVAWWPRDPERIVGGSDEWAPEYRCPKCVEMAERHGVDWPDAPEPLKTGAPPQQGEESP